MNIDINNLLSHNQLLYKNYEQKGNIHARRK